MLDTIRQDVQYAVRSLRRSPGFAAAAILTLALGIGANTAIFSVVEGVLLRPSPFADLDRLAMVWETDRASGTTREPSSVPDYLDFRERTRQFAQLTSFAPAELSVAPDGGDPFRVAAMAVSDGFLSLVGVRPRVGRPFTAAEDRPGAPRVALISEALWERLYGRDPRVAGRTLRISDQAVTIVGVLPAESDFGALQILGAAAYGRGFAERGHRAQVDVWVPLRADPVSLPRDTHPIFVLGRLAAGASVVTAQQELGAVAADLERAYPENNARGVHIEALRQVVFGPVRPALRLLLGAVALVLLVACVNVVNLLLARATARARDVTVRTALGAGRGRIARQFLAEGGVLAAAGGAVGVLLAVWGLDLLRGLAPADIPRIATVGIDLRVLLATVVLSAIVGLACGALPMVQAGRLDLQSALHGTAGRSSTGEHRRLRSGLVVSELALAVMLMVGAGLLIRSLWRLSAVDPGFRAAGVLKAEFELPASRYPQDFANWPRWSAIHAFDAELLARVRALPGVTSVALASNHPLDAGFTSSIVVVGREGEAGDWPEPSIRRVGAGYFEAMGVPVSAGRSFGTADDAAAPPVALVNAAARRRFFADRDPIGQRLRLWGTERTIVGVVGDEHFHGVDAASAPAVYLPLAQAPGGGHSLLIRSRGAPASLAPALHAIVRELDPALPLFGVEPLTQTLADSMAQRRFTMIVLGTFAALALLLAAVGVHGVLSYAVAQRTREIGIRVALGATAGSVRALVVGQGAALAGLGLSAGLLGALALARLLTSLLFGVGPADPATLVAVAGTLGLVALAAAWIPAWRASRVDPVTALRAE